MLRTLHLVPDPLRRRLAALSAEIIHLEDCRERLATQGDYEGLAHALPRVKELAAELGTLTVLIEQDLTELLPADETEIPGVGVVRRTYFDQITIG
jgi:hypothetical protein